MNTTENYEKKGRKMFRTFFDLHKENLKLSNLLFTNRQYDVIDGFAISGRSTPSQRAITIEIKTINNLKNQYTAAIIEKNKIEEYLKYYQAQKSASIYAVFFLDQYVIYNLDSIIKNITSVDQLLFKTIYTNCNSYSDQKKYKEVIFLGFNDEDLILQEGDLPYMAHN